MDGYPKGQPTGTNLRLRPELCHVQYIYPMAHSELLSAFSIAAFQHGSKALMSSTALTLLVHAPTIELTSGLSCNCGLSRSPNRILRQ